MNKLTRRQFLQISGVAAGSLLAGYGCTSKSISPTPTPTLSPTTPPTATPRPPTPTVVPTIPPSPIVLESGGNSGGNKPEVEITFICNEGFLLTSSEGEKILVDALLAGFPQYGVLSREQRMLMEEAKPPFDEIDLILITHGDADHYDFNLVRKHLENDPQTIVVMPETLSARLKGLFPDRVMAIKVDEGKSEALSLNGITVNVLGLRHSTSPYDYFHIGFLFTLGGRQILHTGDFDNNTDALPDDLGKIDLAFMVYWAVEPQANHLIQMHWDAPSPYMPMQTTWILK